jgi:diguanylate cyclase (GGDEF)-like protein
VISLKKYLDAANRGPAANSEVDEQEVLAAAIAEYRSALQEMGNCGMDACPGLGKDLKKCLGKLGEKLTVDISVDALQATGQSIREKLQDWGGCAARHYQHQTAEVKEILLVMANTAESVGERDQRCAKQINEVTSRLQKIANLDDLTQIRASIEKSAGELKTSITRMAAEGKAAIDQLRVEVTGFQAKLEEAEHIASCDALTGLRSRLSVEGQLESRMNSSLPFSVGIIDIDGFKSVNDDHGHIVGDELLVLFATELKSRCRPADIVGRWGGDEFIILLDCAITVARGQTDRLMEWVCGNYTLHGSHGPLKIRVEASIGLAEYFKGETLKALLARADAAMYKHKAASRASGNGPIR